MAAPVAYRTNGQPSARAVVTEPGVYDMTDETYHQDPVPGGSLSSSGAKKLLPPSCPAIFKHERDNPPGPKRTFDLGHAAHKEVLGVGPQIVVIPFDDYRTKQAQQLRDDAYAAGATPLLPHEDRQVKEMAAALRAHPEASRLFSPERGTPEQSLFWVDRDFGMWRRARLDHLPNPTRRRMVIGDYKTCVSAEPVQLQRAMFKLHYHCQSAWYQDAVVALDLAEDPGFVFVCQEKTAPYLITIVEFDDDAARIGRDRNRKALDVYQRCQDSGVWPGYTADILRVSPPAWLVNAHDNDPDMEIF